ncbi:TPA: DUF2955 domain-containing protein [Photobacterium damselae]
MKWFNNIINNKDALRVALTVTVCMMLGKLLHLNSPVYLALYPAIVMTKVKDQSWKGLIKTFIPALAAATLAIITTEIFRDHPFIIWTISILLFDTLRKKADTPPKVGALFMPTINWILNIVFAQHTTMNMPERIHEIFIAMVITAVVTKCMLWLLPKAKGAKPPQFKPHPITFEHRLVSVSLIGVGLGFLMIVNLISAAFCMVPVIAAATQVNRHNYLQVIKGRFWTQVGGCAIAAIFSILMSGHQNMFFIYGIALFVLLYIIADQMHNDDTPAQRDTHADILLATVLPLQLYMNSSELGLSSTFLRGWELAVTLGILWLFHRLTQTREHNGQTHNAHS